MSLEFGETRHCFDLHIDADIYSIAQPAQKHEGRALGRIGIQKKHPSAAQPLKGLWSFARNCKRLVLYNGQIGGLRKVVKRCFGGTSPLGLMVKITPKRGAMSSFAEHAAIALDLCAQRHLRLGG